jgi:phenylpyruvate tautomerase PptA (4-oxalocrotonate tautomerase family)
MYQADHLLNNPLLVEGKSPIDVVFSEIKEGDWSTGLNVYTADEGTVVGR